MSVLKAFRNFHVLKHFIVISETMPQPSDLRLKDNEEILEVKEIYAEVVIK